MKRSPPNKVSFEKFLEMAHATHDGKYTYDASTFDGMKSKITITCPEHGKFSCVGSAHINSKSGCPPCSLARRANARRVPFEDFLQRARDTHGDTYEYVEDSYTGMSDPVEIVCKEHGSFFQKAITHARGAGCKACGVARRTEGRKIPFEVFVARAKEVHGDVYSYDESSYVNSSQKMRITCPTHGVFEQAPNPHTSGRGCPKCAIERSAAMRTIPSKAARDAGEGSQPKYSYENALQQVVLANPSLIVVPFEDSYIGTRTEITLVCDMHGPFTRSWHRVNTVGHTRGCPGCKEEGAAQGRFDRFNSLLKASLGEEFSAVPGTYTSSENPVDIICPDHGVQTVRAGTILYNGGGCPKCAVERRVEAAKIPFEEFVRRAREIHGDTYTYSDVGYKGLTAKVLITCKEHGEFLQLASDHIHSRSGCPKCANARWALINTITFEQFLEKARTTHGDKYSYIEESFTGGASPVRILCPEHGEFSQGASSHASGAGCWDCAVAERGQRLALPFETFVERAREVHGDTYDYCAESYTKYTDNLRITCKKHGVFLQAGPSHVGQQAGCPSCGTKVSKGEREVLEFVKSLGVKVEGSYKYQGNREFDLFLPEHNLAIEYDGLLWHSTRYRDRNQQLMKTRDAESLGVDLIRIFEDEWVHQQEQIKSLLRMRIGVGNSERVFARKCEVREVDNTTARNFYDENHVQGWRRYGTNLGLFYQDKLVALMTFTSTLSSRKKARAGEVELARYATNAQVVGGASKLLKAYIREYAPKLVVSYSDKRMFSGEMYNKLGFSNVADIPPSYTYFNDKRDSLTRHHKSKFQRQHLQRLLGDAFNPEMTEKENAELAGYYQIYDDGKIRWELKL